MLEIPCDQCGDMLTEPGALIFSPPENGKVEKLHLCVVCWGIVKDEIIAW